MNKQVHGLEQRLAYTKCCFRVILFDIIVIVIIIGWSHSYKTNPDALGLW